MPDTIKYADPSYNVREMFESEIVHQRDLHEAETRRVDALYEAEIRRQDDLRAAETRRINQIFALRDKYITEKFIDADTKYQIQFTAAKDAVSIASVAQEKAMAAALEGTKDAINKADVNTDKRFDSLSEKIDGIADTMSKNTGAQGIYVTHTDLSIAMDKLQTGIEATLRPLVTFMNSQQGKTSGANAIWGYLVGAVGIGAAVASLAIKLTGG